MASKNKETFVIWPEYFNSDISRGSGRRMPRSLSVSSPTADDLFSISRKLGLSPVLEKEKSHPSRWFKSSGRVLIPKKHNKTETIRKIAQSLIKMKK